MSLCDDDDDGDDEDDGDNVDNDDDGDACLSIQQPRPVASLLLRHPSL